MRKFYLRVTNFHKRVTGEKGGFEIKKNRNFPVLVINATDLEKAKVLAGNTIRARIKKMEKLGFVKTERAWQRVNGNHVYCFNIFVAESCRSCQGTGWVGNNKCWRCGATGDEELPIHINTEVSISNQSGVDPYSLKVREASVRGRKEAMEPILA